MCDVIGYINANRLEAPTGTHEQIVEMIREHQRSKYEDDAKTWFKVYTVRSCDYLGDDIELLFKVYKSQKRAETAAKKHGGKVVAEFGYYDGIRFEPVFGNYDGRYMVEMESH